MKENVGEQNDFFIFHTSISTTKALNSVFPRGHLSHMEHYLWKENFDAFKKLFEAFTIRERMAFVGPLKSY